MRLVSIQRLLRRGAITNLAKMLARMHPADIANVIDHLSSLKEKREIFELVRGDVKRGQVLSELDGESITLVLSIRQTGQAPCMKHAASSRNCLASKRL